MSRSRRDLRERLMHLSDQSGGLFACWPWRGARKPGMGYGYMGKAPDRTRMAHRVSYEVFVGPVPEGLCVLHRCDNGPCINPAHLFLGTVADNNADMFAKGRGRFPAGDVRLGICNRGHRIEGANAEPQNDGRARCRECHRIRNRVWRARAKSQGQVAAA